MNEIEALDRIEQLPTCRRLGGPAGYNLLYGDNWQNNDDFLRDTEAINLVNAIARKKIKQWHNENPDEEAFSAWHSYKRYVFCLNGTKYAFTEKTVMTDKFRAFAAKNFGLRDFNYIDMRLMYLASIVEQVNKETRFSYVIKNRFGISEIYSRLPEGDMLLDMMNETVAKYDRRSRATAEQTHDSINDGYVPLSIPTHSMHKIHLPEIKVVPIEELI